MTEDEQLDSVGHAKREFGVLGVSWAGYVERAARRLFGIPDFRYYALADSHPGRPHPPSRPPNQHQLDLWNAQPP